MKVGILTLPNATNYGGVLQALAIQQAIAGLGHEAIMLDFREDKRNRRLLGILASRSLRDWIRWCIGMLIANGCFGVLLRHVRTIKYVRQYFKLSRFSFMTWSEVGTHEIDVVSVGSDQIWNPLVTEIGPFLLEGLPFGIRAIAYAASLGCHELGKDYLERYKKGFRSFAAIGVREKELVAIVERQGCKATHVIDPTLLVGRLYWDKLISPQRSPTRRLVCYFLSEDIAAMLPPILQFARDMDCGVDVFVDDYRFPIPHGLAGLFRHFKMRVELLRVHGSVRFSAGPLEFVNAIAHATWVLSNSFHAMMFSSLYDKNIRIVSPAAAYRQEMSARITEFADEFVEGQVFARGLSEALESLRKGEAVSFKQGELARFRNESLLWLKAAIG